MPEAREEQRIAPEPTTEWRELKTPEQRSLALEEYKAMRSEGNHGRRSSEVGATLANSGRSVPAEAPTSPLRT